jgi:hypothetical protein
MNDINRYIVQIMYKIIILVAVISVNVTCYGRYYQDSLTQQLDKLRKYRDEK